MFTSMKWALYRALMRLAHRFNWHYAPPCYPNGDTVLRCAWCGLSYKVPSPDPIREIRNHKRIMQAVYDTPDTVGGPCTEV